MQKREPSLCRINFNCAAGSRRRALGEHTLLICTSLLRWSYLYAQRAQVETGHAVYTWPAADLVQYLVQHVDVAQARRMHKTETLRLLLLSICAIKSPGLKVDLDWQCCSNLNYPLLAVIPAPQATRGSVSSSSLIIKFFVSSSSIEVLGSLLFVEPKLNKTALMFFFDQPALRHWNMYNWLSRWINAEIQK